MPSRERPIDLVHLARQTSGDRQLEEEVLSLFLHQLCETGEQLAHVDGAERSRLAHRLKGAARGVGAFGVADRAERIEEAPQDSRHLSDLSAEIDDVRDFIASICR